MKLDTKWEFAFYFNDEEAKDILKALKSYLKDRDAGSSTIKTFRDLLAEVLEK